MITFNEMSDVFYGFAIEDANETHPYIKQTLASASRDMITESEGLVTSLMVPDIEVPTDYLNRMKNQLNYATLSGLKKQYSAFFNKLASNPMLAEASVYFPMVPDTVGKINAKYLSMFVSEAKTALLAAIKGGKEKLKKIESIIDDEKINKYKLQVAEVTKNGIPDPSAATVLPEPVRIIVNKGSIKESIIPFINASDDAAKNMNKMITVIQSEMLSSKKDLDEFISAVNSIITNTATDVKVRTNVKTYSFEVVTVYRQLVTYLCNAAILKLRYYAFNNTSISNLYNGLTERYGEMMESVDVEKFDIYPDETKIESMQSKGLSISRDLRRTIEDMAVHDLRDSHVYDTISDVEFDHTTYDDTATIFKDIENQIRSFTVSINEGQIFLTAREVAGLQNGLDYIYASKVAQIADSAPKFYKDGMEGATKNAIRLAIVAEMYKSDDLLTGISAQISSCLEYMAQTKLNFQEQINSSNRIPVYEDCIEFFTTIREDLKFFILKIANAFFDRYKYLLTLIETMSPYGSEVPDDVEIVQESDYTEDALRFMVHENDMYNTADCKNVMFAYRAALTMTHEGVYETYEPATIFTEADEQDARQANQQTNNQNAEGGNTSRANRLTEWVKSLLEKFRAAVDKLTKMNESWLNKNEAALRGLQTAEAVTMYPFFSMNPQNIPANITAASGKVKSINVNQLYQKTPESLFDEIYGNAIVPTGKIKLPNGTKRTNAAVVKQYYMVGTRSYQQVQYTSEQVLRNIPAMIDFCKGYERMSNTIRTRLKNLGDAVSAKINEGETLVKESASEEIEAFYNFMMEAEGDAAQQTANPTPVASGNTTAQTGGGDAKAPGAADVKIGTDETKPNKGGGNASAHSIAAHLKTMSADYQAFSSGILSAIEYRYYAYINVLRGLIRASKRSNAQNENQQNQNNEQNNANQ